MLLRFTDLPLSFLFYSFQPSFPAPISRFSQSILLSYAANGMNAPYRDIQRYTEVYRGRRIALFPAQFRYHRKASVNQRLNEFAPFPPASRRVASSGEAHGIYSPGYLYESQRYASLVSLVLQPGRLRRGECWRTGAGHRKLSLNLR